MEPTTPQSSASTNPLLAHLNDTDESHASTKVDFMHPGTVFHPAAPEPVAATPASPPAPAPVAAAAAPTPAPVVAEAAKPAAPKVPVEPPVETPPPPPPPPTPAAAPPAPKSPRNKRPFIIALAIILLLAAAGGGAYYWFKVRPGNQTNEPNQPATEQTVAVEPEAPANLAQKGADGKALAPSGSSKNPIELDFSESTSANSGTLQPQVEVQPIGTPFTGQSNYQGSDTGVTDGSVNGVVTIKDLKDGGYHWQARFVAGTTTGNWTVFAASGVTAADFTIDSTAPMAATITGIGSKTVKAGTTTASTTDSQPTFTGTAEPGSAVALAIGPDNQTASATSDAKGGWSASSSTPLANGDHTVTISTTDSAGNVTSSSFTLSVNTATAAPATTTVAATGDNTLWLTLAGIVLIIVCSGGLVAATRYGRTQV